MKKIKKVIGIGIVAFLIITNFDFFFNLFEQFAVILFVPLLAFVYLYIKHEK